MKQFLKDIAKGLGVMLLGLIIVAYSASNEFIVNSEGEYSNILYCIFFSVMYLVVVVVFIGSRVIYKLNALLKMKD